MAKRNVSISHIEDVDTLFVHFESKEGYYAVIPGDDRVQTRSDV